MTQIPRLISKWDYENHKNRHGEKQNRKKLSVPQWQALQHRFELLQLHNINR